LNSFCYHIRDGIRKKGIRLCARIDPGISEMLREHEGHSVVELRYTL
jgi:hypothetical protein